jgi:hypothetical protein
MKEDLNAAVSSPSSRGHWLLRIIFATTSDHTEFAIDTLTRSLVDLSGWEIEKTPAEKALPQDMLTGVVLLLASATWNAGGIEGQLNPHMCGDILPLKLKDSQMRSV